MTLSRRLSAALPALALVASLLGSGGAGRGRGAACRFRIATSARMVSLGGSCNRCELSGRNLSGATFTGATFTSATLVGANLRGAELVGSNFSGSDFTRADLRGAEMPGRELHAPPSSATPLIGGVEAHGRRLQPRRPDRAPTCRAPSWSGPT